MRRSISAPRLRQWVARLALIVLTEAHGVGVSRAEERILPVPLATIYPGDIIRESMLGNKSFSDGVLSSGSLIDSKSLLLGKIARRTLLPDRPISVTAVGIPKIVAVNAQVKIVFDEGGLVITTYGAALQAGGVGDMIRVRNQDSGSVISGRVQSDGSVLVSDG
jgi:flagella basal body P-ring formation protein FlgA